MTDLEERLLELHVKNLSKLSNLLVNDLLKARRKVGSECEIDVFKIFNTTFTYISLVSIFT